jgi:allantoinase
VLDFTPHTVEFLAGEKLEWHADLTSVDRPHRIKTQSDVIAAVPNGDFTDNRILRSSRAISSTSIRDLRLSLSERAHEHVSAHPHCRIGGRPVIIAVFDQMINIFGTFRASELPDGKLGRWALNAAPDEHTYVSGYFVR